MTKQTKQVELPEQRYITMAYSWIQRYYGAAGKMYISATDIANLIRKSEIRGAAQAQQEVVERVTPVIDRLISLRDEIPHSNATRDSERFAYQKAIDLLVALQQEQE